MHSVDRYRFTFIPFDMIPYSFGGMSVNEWLPPMYEGLCSFIIEFGPLRAGRILLSGRAGKTISCWLTFVVVSFTRDAIDRGTEIQKMFFHH